jgi:hypothetical protein
MLILFQHQSKDALHQNSSPNALAKRFNEYPIRQMDSRPSQTFGCLGDTPRHAHYVRDARGRESHRYGNCLPNLQQLHLLHYGISTHPRAKLHDHLPNNSNAVIGNSDDH